MPGLWTWPFAEAVRNARKNPMRGYVSSLWESRAGLASPLSLPRRWRGAVVAFAAGAGVVGICAVEFIVPSLTSLGSLLLLPVLLSAWLLDAPAFLAIVILALGSRFAAALGGGLDIGTVVAESAAIVMLAGTARLAAAATIRARALEQRLARLDERDRIAAELQSAALKKLFQMTLTIEAAVAAPPAESSKRLQSVVAELDDLIAQIRRSVFAK
jgi:signal transduction histidine kinase